MIKKTKTITREHLGETLARRFNEALAPLRAAVHRFDKACAPLREAMARLGTAGQASAAWGQKSGFADLYTVFSDSGADEARQVAAERLLDVHLHGRPIARPRWLAHEGRLSASLEDQAAFHRTTRKREFRQRAIQAIFVYAADAGPMTPRQAITLLWPGVSALLMEDLVPGWRAWEKRKAPSERKAPRKRKTPRKRKVLRMPGVQPQRHSLESRLAAEKLLARARLSRREKEVVAAVGQGQLLSEAARALGIAPATARAFWARARRKISHSM